MIRSMASLKSSLSTSFLFLRAAIRAASLHTFAMSAPENPGVCLASQSRSTLPLSYLRSFECTLKIALRSSRSGSSTLICRSKRPALSRARSSMSALLVAAISITPEFVLKPSISVSSWFRVLSLSSLAPVIMFLPLALPMASISSMKMIHGAFSLACLNRSLTREAPTPTNISTKSEPESEKKGTCASPATALASKVLPVPGGPTSNTPLGILPPNSVYLAGFFRKSTTSFTSTFASSRPATSLKSMETLVDLSNSWAFDLPILKICPPGPPDPRLIILMINIHTTTRSTIGKIQLRTSPDQFVRFTFSI